MPKINRDEFMSTDAKVGGGGGFEQMLPGIYELKIAAIRTEWDTKQGHTNGMDKQCVKIVWDVASGDFADKYSEAYFVDWDGKPLADKDFMHSCFMSWKNMAYFKHNIEVLNACNPNFDALAAFEADRWDMFIGRKFYAVVNGEVKLNAKGYDQWSYDIGAWLTPAQVASGEYEATTTDKRTASSSVPPTSVYNDIVL